MQQALIPMPVKQRQTRLWRHTCNHFAPFACTARTSLNVENFSLCPSTCYRVLKDWEAPSEHHAVGQIVQSLLQELVTIKYSLASLQAGFLPAQIHKQGIGGAQPSTHVYTVIVVPVEALPWLISAQLQAALDCRHGLSIWLEGSLAVRSWCGQGSIPRVHQALKQGLGQDVSMASGYSCSRPV